MREVAREADVSLGQIQHYFSSRGEMLAFAMDFAAEQTAGRVAQGMESLAQPPHPKEVLRIAITELLPLQANARTTSRMSAAYVLEALHDPALRERAGAGLRDGRALVERLVRDAMNDGYIDAQRDPSVETDRILALSGFATLIELDVVQPQAAIAAIDRHLDELFRLEPASKG